MNSTTTKPAHAAGTSSPLGRFLRSLRLVFFGDVAVQRKGRSLRVTLVDRKAEAAALAAAVRSPADEAPAADSVLLMRQAVKKVLDGHAGARKVFRYLRYLECDLKKNGGASFAAMPAKVLLKANAQLEALVCDWSDPGLALLRSQLGAQIAARASDFDSDFCFSSPVADEDGRLSEFLEFALSQPMTLRTNAA